MTTGTKTATTSAVTTVKRVTKKEKVLSLFSAGITGIEEISAVSGVKASYVASILDAKGLAPSNFDLFTSTKKLQNIYSGMFKDKLGFKDVEAATASVEALRKAYNIFLAANDIGGKHHIMSLALVMFNRAQATGKLNESKLFGDWLKALL